MSVLLKKVENDTVYTIEGNTRGDMCKENQYKINSSVILGYGTPEYNKKVNCFLHIEIINFIHGK